MQQNDDLLVPRYSEDDQEWDQDTANQLAEVGVINESNIHECRDDLRAGGVDAVLARKRGGQQSNDNAQKYEHEGRVVRLSGGDTDLLYDFFATEGKANPSTADFKIAVHYAIVQVYGRRVEDQKAMIL